MFAMAKNSLKDLSCYGIKALDKLNTFRKIPLLYTVYILMVFLSKTFLLQISTSWFPYLVTFLKSPLIFRFGSALAYSSTERKSNSSGHSPMYASIVAGTNKEKVLLRINNTTL